MITPEKIYEWLDYFPDTGTFFWKKSPARGVLAGTIAGEKTNEGYIRVQIEGKRYLGHRLAWVVMNGSEPRNQIDHINGKKSDNRINNLRPATNGQNQHNVGPRKTNTSGFKGVTKSRERWKAVE